jgi:hypothetical protein
MKKMLSPMSISAVVAIIQTAQTSILAEYFMVRPPESPVCWYLYRLRRLLQIQQETYHQKPITKHRHREIGPL